MTQTLIAAHRGGADLWPENSLLAFRQTLILPVDLVEFDVHRTRDGTLVVHHDATVDRMTDGSGAIASKSFAELSQFVIRGTGGERIPTLQEVMDVFAPSNIGLRLEIKSGPDLKSYEGIEAEIYDALLQNRMLDRSMVTSFQLSTLARFAHQMATHPNPPALVWLVSPLVLACSGPTGIVAAARAHGIRELGLKASDLDPGVLYDVKEGGCHVHAWAAHTLEAAKRMFELNVESFTSDRPDLALQAKGGVQQ